MPTPKKKMLTAAQLEKMKAALIERRHEIQRLSLENLGDVEESIDEASGDSADRAAAALDRDILVDAAAREAVGSDWIAPDSGTWIDNHGTDAIGGMTSRIMTSSQAKCATDGFRRVRPMAHASIASGKDSSAFPSAYSRTVRVMASPRQGAHGACAARRGSGASGR